VLAAGCLVGDLAIQQHMWNLGMANIAGTNEDEFMNIMKVNSYTDFIYKVYYSLTRTDDYPGLDTLCYISLAHQSCLGSVLQEAGSTGLRFANCL
jgi:hypothetical protein